MEKIINHDINIHASTKDGEAVLRITDTVNDIYLERSTFGLPEHPSDYIAHAAFSHMWHEVEQAMARAIRRVEDQFAPGQYVATIEQDMYPSNPITDWDVPTSMVEVDRWGRVSYAGWMSGELKEYEDLIAGKDWDALVDGLTEAFPGCVIEKLFKYSHSGDVYRVSDKNPFTCRWDSGHVGFVITTPERFKETVENKPITRERAIEVMAADIENLNTAISGDVWMITIANERTGEELDGCGGFYGLEYAIEDATDRVRGLVEGDKGSTGRVIHPIANGEAVTFVRPQEAEEVA